MTLILCASGLFAQKVEFEKGDKTLKGDLLGGTGKKILLESSNRNILVGDFVIEYPTQQYAGADVKGGSQGLIGSSVGIMGTISNPDADFLVKLSGEIFQQFMKDLKDMGFNPSTITAEEARSQKLFSKKEGKGSRIVNGESWEIESKKPALHSILTRPAGVDLPIFDHKILAEGHLTNLAFALRGADAVKAIVKIKVSFMTFDTRSTRLASSVEARTSIDVGNIETNVKFVAHKNNGKPATYQVRTEAPIYIDDNSYIIDASSEKKNILGNKRTWNTYTIDHDKYGSLAKATCLAFLKEAFTVYGDYLRAN